jgi:hypothetical protein
MSSGESTSPPPGPPSEPPGDPRAEPTSTDSTVASGPTSTTSLRSAMTSAAESTTTRSEWPSQAADLVVDVVDSVRAKTTTPVFTIARAIVYGTAIAFLAAMALVLLIVGVVRLIDNYLPGEVWATYLLLGSVMFVVGLFLWSTRRPRDAS